jgi:hypothetical protein
MNSEEKKTKYENPKLIDLNEEFGSGECNAGSGVMLGYPADCTDGASALHLCSHGLGVGYNPL